MLISTVSTSIIILITLMIMIPFFKGGKNKSFLLLVLALNIIAPLLLFFVGGSLMSIFLDEGGLELSFSILLSALILVIYLGIILFYLHIKKTFTLKNFLKFVALSIVYVVSLFIVTMLSMFLVLGTSEQSGSPVGAIITGFAIGPILGIFFNLIITALLYKYFSNKKAIQAQSDLSSSLQTADTISQPINKRRVSPWIKVEILLAIILLILITALYLTPIIKDKKAISEIPMPTPISTSESKTFAGEYIGISFKYPSEWLEKHTDRKVSSFVFRNEYVTQLPADEEHLTNYYCDKKIANTIDVKKFPKRENFNKHTELFKNIKNIKQNEVFENKEDFIKYYKIQDGKVSSGEDYVMYLIKKSYECDIYSVSVLGNDAIYYLKLYRYNKEGINVLYNIIPSIQISHQPIPWRTYEADKFYIDYPPDGLIEGSKDIHLNLGGGRITFLTEIHKNGDWRESYLESLKESDAKVEEINGYHKATIEKKDKIDIIFVKDDYTVTLSLESHRLDRDLEENDLETLREMALTIKFK